MEAVDVFISYKQNERAAIEQVAERLRTLGLSVWFDASMSAGESFNDAIDREARSAKARLQYPLCGVRARMTASGIKRWEKV